MFDVLLVLDMCIIDSIYTYIYIYIYIYIYVFARIDGFGRIFGFCPTFVFCCFFGFRRILGFGQILSVVIKVMRSSIAPFQAQGLTGKYRYSINQNCNNLILTLYGNWRRPNVGLALIIIGVLDL